MELSNSNIKKIPIFLEMKPCTFQPQFSKCFPKKKLLYFFNKKTRSEKISYIFSKERFSYIAKNGSLYFSAQAQRIRKSTSRKFFILQEMETLQKLITFFSKRKLLLYFGKRKL